MTKREDERVLQAAREALEEFHPRCGFTPVDVGEALVSYLRGNDSADKTIEWIGLLKQDYKKFCKEK